MQNKNERTKEFKDKRKEEDPPSKETDSFGSEDRELLFPF